MARKSKSGNEGTPHTEAHQKRSQEPDRPGSKQWLRILTEVFAIIVSILLAFAIEAWWSEQKEREVEMEILLGILEDFSINSDQLDIVEEKHRMALDASNALISIIGPDARLTIPDDSIESLIASLRNNWTYDPISGTLYSLLHSDISLISNKEQKFPEPDRGPKKICFKYPGRT